MTAAAAQKSRALLVARVRRQLAERRGPWTPNSCLLAPAMEFRIVRCRSVVLKMPIKASKSFFPVAEVSVTVMGWSAVGWVLSLLRPPLVARDGFTSYRLGALQDRWYSPVASLAYLVYALILRRYSCRVVGTGRVSGARRGIDE